MSCSKPLPAFAFDMLCYLNRDKLERFSIVCRPLKNIINRYFHSKPYRVFDQLVIRAGSYSLEHNDVFWHPNRDDYSAQQFLAGKISNIGHTYYSFAEMRPYLGPAVRIKWTVIYVRGESMYNPEQIEQMESIANLWQDGKISIWNSGNNPFRTRAADLHLILNSSIILQCRNLDMDSVNFSFKDYEVLYSVKIIEKLYYFKDDIDLRLQYWQQFLEKPGVKPVVALRYLRCENIGNLIGRLSKDFSCAVSPNAFKIVFAQCNKPLTEFHETNSTSREKFELKKGLPAEYQVQYLEKFDNYTLERSSI